MNTTTVVVRVMAEAVARISRVLRWRFPKKHTTSRKGQPRPFRQEWCCHGCFSKAVLQFEPVFKFCHLGRVNLRGYAATLDVSPHPRLKVNTLADEINEYLLWDYLCTAPHLASSAGNSIAGATLLNSFLDLHVY